MKKNPPIIKNAVLAMGGTIEEFIPERGCFYINIAGKRILIERKISITRQFFVSRQLTACKDITYKLLLNNNLPTPKTVCFYQKTYHKQRVEKQLNLLAYPIVIKDARGSQCKGVFSFIRNLSDAMILIERELPRYRSMIAQEMVFGKEYRILVLDEKVIGALELISPYIVGDGVSTVQEIIERKQYTSEWKTEFYDGLETILKDQDVTLESIVPKNTIIYIKQESARTEAWKMRDVTSDVHEGVEKICVAASKAVGKYLVGIDVICTDISQDPLKQPFTILEINGKPDLYIHYNPTHGHTRNVVEDIVKFMIKTA